MILAKNAVKAKILEYFRYVESTGEEIVVTDHGRPCVRISAIKRAGSVEEVFAQYRGQTAVRGDILAPVEGEWELS